MILHADSLIGQARHKGAVCGLIGEKMHEISCGVCANVGGIRFHPSQSPTGPSAQSPQRSEVYFPRGSNCAPTVHFDAVRFYENN
jgi:hypothetical protein